MIQLSRFGRRRTKIGCVSSWRRWRWLNAWEFYRRTSLYRCWPRQRVLLSAFYAAIVWSEAPASEGRESREQNRGLDNTVLQFQGWSQVRALGVGRRGAKVASRARSLTTALHCTAWSINFRSGESRALEHLAQCMRSRARINSRLGLDVHTAGACGLYQKGRVRLALLQGTNGDFRG
jgi:hypothetical protein